jgi:hypothetical protein
VPLRFPRPVLAAAAIGLAAALTALGAAPALAYGARNQEWWLAKLHVTQAWQVTRGSGVTVALLDTGVDPAQPDLSGSVITGLDFTSSAENQGSPFFGIHGTAMASLIVGHGHGRGNGAGVIGVAPDARLLSVRVGLDGGDPLLSSQAVVAGLPGAIAAGIRYAVSNGAQVIDLPLDPGQTPPDLVAPDRNASSSATTPPPDGTPAEQSAVAFALTRGVVLVAPAGDNGAGTDAPNFPAGYPGVISVGAVSRRLVKARYSSRQPYVTLTAAGDGMIAAVPPDRYATVSSTSAASAVVTGIVALIKAQFPELTPAQVAEALTLGTASKPPAGAAGGSGHGTADAAHALAAAARIAAPALRRAGAGAVSRQLPRAPSGSPQASDTMRLGLERDALISLSVLGFLLLATMTYWLRGRRRARARALAQARREQAARAPYAPNGDTAAGVMREYFAALPGQAGNGDYAADSYDASGSGTRGRAAHGTGMNGAAILADPAISSGAGDDAAPRTGVQFPRSPLTPITRAGTPRPPKVSGTPPWEPAQKPEGELPWTSSPAPPALPRRGPAHAMPAAGSIWDGPIAGAHSFDAAADPAADGGDDGNAQSGGRPIYVWNPGAATDTFPQVPPNGRDAGF